MDSFSFRRARELDDIGPPGTEHNKDGSIKKKKNYKPVLEFPPDNDYLQAQLQEEETIAEEYERLQLDIVQLHTEVEALRAEVKLAEKLEKQNQKENKEFMQKHADLYNFDVTAETLREKQSRIVNLQQKSCQLENYISDIKKGTAKSNLAELRVEIGLLKKDVERYNASIGTLSDERKKIVRTLEVQRQKLGLDFITDNNQYISELKQLLYSKREKYEKYKQYIDELKNDIEEGNKFGFNNEILLEKRLNSAQNKYNEMMAQYVKQTKDFQTREAQQRKQLIMPERKAPRVSFFLQEPKEDQHGKPHLSINLPKPKSTGYVPDRNIADENANKLETEEKRIQREGNKRDFITSRLQPKDDKNLNQQVVENKKQEEIPSKTIPKQSNDNTESTQPQQKEKSKIETTSTKDQKKSEPENPQQSNLQPPVHETIKQQEIKPKITENKTNSTTTTSETQHYTPPSGFASKRRTINFTNLRNESKAREICSKFGTILNITEDTSSTRVTFSNHEQAMKALIGLNGQKVENIFLNIGWGTEPESLKTVSNTQPVITSTQESQPTSQPVIEKQEKSEVKSNPAPTVIEEEIIVDNDSSSSISSKSSKSSDSSSSSSSKSSKKSSSSNKSDKSNNLSASKKSNEPEPVSVKKPDPVPIQETQTIEIGNQSHKDEKSSDDDIIIESYSSDKHSDKEDTKEEKKDDKPKEEKVKSDEEPIIEEELILDDDSEDMSKTKTIQPSGQKIESSSSQSDIIIMESSDNDKKSESEKPTKQQADAPANQESSDDSDTDDFF